MKRKQTTALILAALITASMAGCQAGSAQTAPQVTAGATEQTDVLESTSEAVTELTALAETTVEPTAGTGSKHGWDYADFEELPEGWTMEKLFNMISIGGYQLSFPCTVDDILALSEDFTVGEETPYYSSDGMIDGMIVDLKYKDYYVAIISYDEKRNISAIGISNYSIDKDNIVTICDVELTDREAMADLLSTLGENVSSNDGVSIRERYIDEKYAVYFTYLDSSDLLRTR